MSINHVKRLLTVAAGAALLGVAAPAVADSSYCAFGLWPLGSSSCTTGGVLANRTGHFVYISVSPRTRYEVVDTNNGVTVASGQAGNLGKRRTIFGLYSRYRLWVGGVAGSGYINNT